jgi:hypothetical protein
MMRLAGGDEAGGHPPLSRGASLTLHGRRQ